MKIGLCGLGTVASSVVNILVANKDLINQRASTPVELAHIGARRDNPDCDTNEVKVSRDIFEVARDPEVEVLVELIGGTDTARELVVTAINNGKHVVTANKALMAEHGDEILSLAGEKGVQVRFEAAVAGGIPVVRALTEGLGANNISRIAGIINGTSNFILSEMGDHGRSYADALADAQQLGYAEADPTFDVEGIDAAQKLVILAALAFGLPFDVRHCFTEGISSLSVQDLRYARELGYHIKHLGLAAKTDAGVELRVHPALVEDSQLISQVNGVMNAVYIKDDMVGSTLYYGAGAGGNATASAILSDVISLARNQQMDYLASSITAGTGKGDRPAAGTHYIDINDTENAYYLRINVTNKAGALSQITNCLGQQDISVDALHQSGAHEHRAERSADRSQTVPVVLTSSKVIESNMLKAVEAIKALHLVEGEITLLRIIDLE